MDQHLLKGLFPMNQQVNVDSRNKKERYSCGTASSSKAFFSGLVHHRRRFPKALFVIPGYHVVLLPSPAGWSLPQIVSTWRRTVSKSCQIVSTSCRTLSKYCRIALKSCPTLPSGSEYLQACRFMSCQSLAPDGAWAWVCCLGSFPVSISKTVCIHFCTNNRSTTMATPICHEIPIPAPLWQLPYTMKSIYQHHYGNSHMP